jgi:phosphoribosylamine--glycine ligase
MNIAIFGSNHCLHFFSQYLEKYENVNNVYHYSAGPLHVPTEKYHPIIFKETLEEYLNEVDTLKEKEIDLIIPLTLPFQLWSKFQNKIRDTGIPVLSPTSDLAMLEWSKIYGKKFMQSIGVPTAKHKTFLYDEIIDNFFTIERPFVLKFDQDFRFGRQSIVVTENNLNEVYTNFLDTGKTRMSDLLKKGDHTDYIIEEFLAGPEYSLHILCNGTNWSYLGSSRDYKKEFNSDTGNNVCSMGCYSVTDPINDQAVQIVNQVLTALENNGTPYVGVLYLGMIIHNGVHKVLEINTRPGNPEFNTILSMIDDNIVELFFNCVNNNVKKSIRFKSGSAVTIQLVHKDYILEYRENVKYPILKDIPPDIIVSYGSLDPHLRYCNLTATGETPQLASEKILDYLDKQYLGDFRYRTDIGMLP